MKFRLSSVAGGFKNPSPFVANVLILAGGTAIAQILGFLFSVITSRIYSPEDYGTIAVFNSTVSILSVVSTGQYSTAIMVDKDQESAKSTFALCAFLSAGFSLLALVFLFLYRFLRPASGLFTGLMTVLIPVQILTGGLSDSCRHWCNRCGIYAEISKLSVAGTVISFCFTFLFGILKFKSAGLLLAGTISQTAGLLLMFFCICKKTDFTKQPFSLSAVRKQARLHADYPRFNILAQFMNTASTQLPVILFAKFYSAAAVGGYSRAIQVINIPIVLIGNSVGNVFFKEAASAGQAGDKSRLSRIAADAYKKLLLTGILPMSVLFGYGDLLFGFVFGPSWRDAGRYAQILAPWFALISVTSPLSSLLFVLRKQKQNTFIQFILLLSSILAVLCGEFFRLEFSASLLVFSLAGAVVWIFINSYMFKLVKIPFAKSALYAAAGISAVFSILLMSRFLLNLLLRLPF